MNIKLPFISLVGLLTFAIAAHADQAPNGENWEEVEIGQEFTIDQFVKMMSDQHKESVPVDDILAFVDKTFAQTFGKEWAQNPQQAKIAESIKSIVTHGLKETTIEESRIPYFPVVTGELDDKKRAKLVQLLSNRMNQAPAEVPLSPELKMIQVHPQWNALISKKENSFSAGLGRWYPTPINADHEFLKNLYNAHFPNKELTDEEVFQSRLLARILNELSDTWENERNSVQFESGKSASTTKEFFQALADNGYTIDLKGETMFADFAGLAYLDGKKWHYVRLPVWMDTKIPVQWPGKSQLNRTLRLPSTHAQLTWHVKNAEQNFDAEVTFFLGVQGVGFFPKVTQRPLWTGTKAQTVATCTAGRGSSPSCDVVSQAATYSTDYRNIVNRVTQSSPFLSRLPIQGGYGVNGVCNDSASVAWYLTEHYANFNYPEQFPKAPEFHYYPLIGRTNFFEVLDKNVPDWQMISFSEKLVNKANNERPQDFDPENLENNHSDKVRRIKESLPYTPGQGWLLRKSVEMDVQETLYKNL